MKFILKPKSLSNISLGKNWQFLTFFILKERSLIIHAREEGEISGVSRFSCPEAQINRPGTQQFLV